jgi:hypothetical protein
MIDEPSPSRLRPRWQALLAALLIALVAGPAAVHAYRTSVWVYPDPDFILAYHALIFAEGLPQDFFDHTAYLYLLLLGGWYQLLHAVAVLGAPTVSALPPMADRSGFDAAWAAIIQAGRAFSILTTTGFVLLFALLVGRWRKDWRLGLLAGLLLAAAPGAMSQAYYLRTELISSMLVMLTIFCVIFAPRQPTIERQLALLAGAGLFAMLAVATKVFAVVPLLAVPLLAFALRDARDCGPKRIPLAPRTAAVVIAIFALASVAAIVLVAGTISRRWPFSYTPVVFGLFGLYQALIAVAVVAAMAIYAWLRDVPWRIALAAMAALGTGIALGVLALGIKYDATNVVAILNPVEHMYGFAIGMNPDILSGGLLTRLAKGIGGLFTQRFLRTPTNMIILEWLTLGGMAIGWRDRDRKWIWQAGLLLCIVWGLQAVFGLRQLILWYYAYTDPFVILAAVIVAARWQGVLSSKRGCVIAVAFLILYFVMGHLQIRGMTRLHSSVKASCEWHHAMLKRLETFPDCRK